MKKSSILALALAGVLLAMSGGWLYVKLRLARETQPFMTYWNDARSCRIDAYAPRFSSYGLPGKLVKLFSSDSFFRVYSHDGVLLRSSEWHLWHREFGQSESARWAGNQAIYPTSSGYQGWVIDDCR